MMDGIESMKHLVNYLKTINMGFQQ